MTMTNRVKFKEMKARMKCKLKWHMREYDHAMDWNRLAMPIKHSASPIWAHEAIMKDITEGKI